MKEDILEYMESEGSSLPKMVKTLLENGWVTYKHHDNWINKNILNEYDTTTAYGICVDELGEKLETPKTDIKHSMDILRDALFNDKGYKISWVCNIAMSFKDEYRRQNPEATEDEIDMIHSVANKSAENFISLLFML